MLIRLLIDHPYIGPKGTVVERSEKDARAMIGNRLAEAVESAVVSNKKLNAGKVRTPRLKTEPQSEASV